MGEGIYPDKYNTSQHNATIHHMLWNSKS